MEQALSVVNLATEIRFFLILGTTKTFLRLMVPLFDSTFPSTIWLICKLSLLPTIIESSPLYGVSFESLPGSLMICVVAPESA